MTARKVDCSSGSYNGVERDDFEEILPNNGVRQVISQSVAIVRENDIGYFHV